jgi:hypothetical protein
MKKIKYGVLALAGVIAFTACAGGSDAEPVETEAPVVTESPVGFG